MKRSLITIGILALTAIVLVNVFASGINISISPNTLSLSVGRVSASVLLPDVGVNSKSFSAASGYFGLNAGSAAGDENANALNAMRFLCDFSDPFTISTDLTYATADLPGVVWGGKLFAFGGYGTTDTDYLAWTQIFDPSTGWSTGANMTAARWGASAAVYNGKAYIFGGRGSGATTACGIYDIAGNSWTTGTAIPTAFSDGSMAATVGDYIYLFYGTTVYQFNPAGNGGLGSYTTKTSAPVPKIWGNCSYVSVEGEDRIYIIGGSDSGVYSNTNYYYHISTDNWSGAQAVMPYTSHGVTRESTVYNGKIYVAFGYDGGNFYSGLYQYDPSTNTWAAGILSHAPGGGRDGMASGIIGTTLYVVGGRNVSAAPYGLKVNECVDLSQSLSNTAGWINSLRILFDDTTPDGNVELGVYADNAGVPGALLLDAGNVAVANGSVSISGLNLAVNNTYYWLAFDLQIKNAVRYQTGKPTNSHAYRTSITYGALPSTFTPEGYNTSQYVMDAYVNTVPPTSGIYSPAAASSNWSTPVNAYSSDNQYATHAPSATQNQTPTASTNGAYPWTNPLQGTTSNNTYATAVSTIPTYRATGAMAHGTTGSIAPALPTGTVANDIVILVASTIAGGSITMGATGSITTWTALTGSPIDVTGGEKLYVWWGRASGTGTTGPTLTPGGDHSVGRTVGFSACYAGGSPIDVSATDTETASDTSFSFATGLTTAYNNEMVIVVCSTGNDPASDSTAQFGTWTGTNLGTKTERIDNDVNEGGGGGFGVMTAPLVANGAVGTVGATLAAVSPKSYIAFALRSTVPGNTFDQIYGNFGITGSGTITKLEIGYEVFATATQTLNIYDSVNGGSAWSSAHLTANLATSDPNSYTYIDITADNTTWDWSKLNNTNFKIKIASNWVNGTPTWSLDALIARVTSLDATNLTEVYSTFGISLAGNAITKVEAGIEAFAASGENVSLEVSSNGGLSWSSAQNSSSLGSSDNNSITWFDFTSARLWTPTSLNSTNLQVRITWVTNGSYGQVSLDWIPVRVTYTPYMDATSVGSGYRFSIPSTGDVVEIGGADILLSGFKPSAKLDRWGSECSLSVSYTTEVSLTPTLSNGKVNWDTTNLAIDFYCLPAIQSESEKFEYEVTLKNKPASNILALNIDLTGLVAYYQPPLNQETHKSEVVTCTETQGFDAGGNLVLYRPENIVGSYAVYHTSKSGDYSAVGGKNYATGLAFWIYRPRVIDSTGNWTWASLLINAGIMTITIPQAFLDAATYPVVIDPTFGYGGTGSGEKQQANELIGSRFTAPADVGTATNITMYASYESGAANVKGIIVLQSTDVIIANGVTAGKSLPANSAWTTANFATPPTLTPNIDYILCAIGDAQWWIDYASGTANYQYYDDSNSYATPTNPTDKHLYDSKYSIYCTYVAGGTPSLTNTPNTLNLGTLWQSKTYYAKGNAPGNPVETGNCTFIITNNGSITENITASMTNMTGGTSWTITSSAPGLNTFRMTAYTAGSDPANGVVLSTSAKAFKNGLAASANISWDFKYETGTWADGDVTQRSGTLQLTAIAP